MIKQAHWIGLAALTLAIPLAAQDEDEDIDPVEARREELGDWCEGLLGPDAKECARKLYTVAQSEDVLLIPARGLERAAQAKDNKIRNYAAQISLRFAAAGGDLSVNTLARFTRDRSRQIRNYRSTDPAGEASSWGDLLVRQVQRGSCSAADVASIGSVTVHEDSLVRLHGFRALAKAKGAPGRADLMIHGLNDDMQLVRKSCATWLVEMDRQAALNFQGPKAAVPALIKALDQRPHAIRAAAALALGRIGPAAKAAVPRLKELAQKHPDPAVVEATGKALKRIKGAKPGD